MKPRSFQEKLIFNGRYKITSDGDVFSLYHKNGRIDRLRPEPLKLKHRTVSGYACISINRRSKFVHSMVLAAFVGPRPKGMVAAHNNGIKTDNRLENLRWCTQKENIADKRKHGTHQIGERNTSATLTVKDVMQIKLFKGIKSQREVANDFGISQSQVGLIWRGDNWAEAVQERIAAIKAELFEALMSDTAEGTKSIIDRILTKHLGGG